MDNESTFIRSVQQERQHLFGGRSISRTQSRRKIKSQKTWSVSFVCLANKNQKKIPTAAEKSVLFSAGLGLKKIQLKIEDSEDDLIETLMSEFGFPQLKEAGGFELMRCKQNCREIEIIDCSWTVSDLRSYLGGQAKIYLRPVQKNLSTKSIVTAIETQRKEKCGGCGLELNIRELRNHILACTESSNIDDSSSDSFDGSISIHTSCQTQTTSQQRFQRVETQRHEIDTIETELPDIQRSQRVETQPHGIDTLIDTETPETHRSQRIEIQPPETGNLGETQTPDQQRVEIQPREIDAFIETQTPDPQRSQRVEAQSREIDNLIDAETADPQGSHRVETETDEMDILIENCISELIEQNISDPVQMLKYLQSNIVTGRGLEVDDETVQLEGDTNFILVDRNDLLKTAFEEIGNLNSLRQTLEVQFYGEVATDYGGPRKEFFRLILGEIKAKYFSPLRILGTNLNDYELIGKIFALSILQNGKIPQFMDPALITELFYSESPSPVVKRLRKGLDVLGLYRVGSRLPMFLHLLRSSSVNLTFRRFTSLFKPLFHEDGSNTRRYENLVYSEFLKYARESASGRRENSSLQKMLQFATGTDEEPLLGFQLSPTIDFVESSGSFLPTSNTCINRMNLPRPSAQVPLPDTDTLFRLYDYAFCNEYYGLS